MTAPTLLIFGLGYSAGHLARRLKARGWRIEATGRAGNLAFDDSAGVTRALAGASHVLSSVPPADGVDPVLATYGPLLERARDQGRWLGYLSSTGVYGDVAGAWVDESASLAGAGSHGRRVLRTQADTQWLALGARVFRLPGIYGPGRSAFDRLAEGRAHRIAQPGQLFSRVHVDDIAGGVLAALETGAPAGAYNLADDAPCHPNRVIEEACRLAGLPLPPLQDLAQAGLSPAARAFYGESRKVANGKARRLLGWQPAYPDWRAGLAAIWRGSPCG